MSRLKPKSTEESWVKERRKICHSCPFNTDNIKDKSLFDNLKIQANQLLNFIFMRKVSDKATCTVCGCMLVFKTAEKDEYCPKNKWKIYENN